MTTAAEQDRTDVETALEAYKAEYVRCGYMYAGEMSPDYLGRETGLGFDRALAAIKQLTADGVIRRRNCQSWTYELVPAERRALIDAHGLREAWQATAAHFYPNHPQYGEVACVLHELETASL